MLDIIDLLFISGLTNLAVEELGHGGAGLNTHTPSTPQKREAQEREAQERLEIKREALLKAKRLETERRKKREQAARIEREQWLSQMNNRYPGVRWR